MKPLESDVPLTEFQIEVARLFFELQESRGFVLAGGATLVALGLTNRPTQDLVYSPRRVVEGWMPLNKRS